MEPPRICWPIFIRFAVDFREILFPPWHACTSALPLFQLGLHRAARADYPGSSPPSPHLAPTVSQDAFPGLDLQTRSLPPPLTPSSVPTAFALPAGGEKQNGKLLPSVPPSQDFEEGAHKQFHAEGEG